MQNEKRAQAHNLILEGRKRLSVSGVGNVESFNENVIVLLTDMGVLTVKGSDLHVSRLSVESGDAVIDGGIDSCVYSDSSSKEGFFARLLK